MQWIQVSDTEKRIKLINLDFYRSIEPVAEGIQTKFLHSTNEAYDITADVNFGTVSTQILLFTTGSDLSGNPL